MLFVRTDKVFAKVGGGNSSWGYDKTAPIPSSEFDGYGGQQADRLAESYGAKVPEDCWQYVLGLE